MIIFHHRQGTTFANPKKWIRPESSGKLRSICGRDTYANTNREVSMRGQGFWEKNSLIVYLLLIWLTFSLMPQSVQAKTSPYPDSQVIESITWDFSNLVRLAPGSDLWPTTWAVDGNLYTSWGDGGGFGGTNADGRVSLGFARLEGPATAFTPTNVWGGKSPENPATFGGKSSGMLSVGGVLYAWVNVQNASPPDIKLAWSADLGKTWQLANWTFPDPSSPTFFPSTFLNFGMDYAGARDGFVYVYGGKWIWTQGAENNVYLARVPKDQLTDRAAYEFFKGLDNNGNPTWTPDITRRQPVFTDPSGVSNTALTSAVYNPALGRYLMTIAHRPQGSSLTAGVGQLGVFDTPEPWGPWTTVGYYNNWGGFGTDEALVYALPTKWISSDGKTIWCIFSSLGILDSFNLVKGTLVLKSTTGDIIPPSPPTNVTVN